MPRIRSDSRGFGLVAAALVATLGGCAEGRGEPERETSAPGDCSHDTNTPGSSCVSDIRFDFDPSEVTLDADLESAGIDFSPPADGFQIETEGVRLASGEDDEWCEAFVVPEDPATPEREYCVDRIELAMTDGYHHLFVASAPFGSDSERLMKVGERVRCVGGAPITYGDDLQPIPVFQDNYLDMRFWKDVGIKVHAGQKLSVNYHWLNTSDGDQIAVTRLNFHARSCDGMAELRQFGFYNQDIAVPPKGTYATTMSGTFTQDIYVRSFFRHTHGHGTDVPISYYRGPQDGETIFVSTDYQDDSLFNFETPRLFHAGEGLKFTCNFENPTEHSIGFGPTADDEMCMLIGYYWLADQSQTPELQHRYKF